MTGTSWGMDKIPIDELYIPGLSKNNYREGKH